MERLIELRPQYTRGVAAQRAAGLRDVLVPLNKLPGCERGAAARFASETGRR
jgi:hypothetical protein